MPVFDKILFWQKKFCIYTEKFPKIYNSFSKIDKISSKINKNLPKINRICQKLTKIRQNQRKFVENRLKFGTKIWHCHPSSPKNFPVLCRFFKISSSKKRHKSGTRLYILRVLRHLKTFQTFRKKNSHRDSLRRIGRISAILKNFGFFWVIFTHLKCDM